MFHVLAYPWPKTKQTKSISELELENQFVSGLNIPLPWDSLMSTATLRSHAGPTLVEGYSAEQRLLNSWPHLEALGT